MVVATAAPCAFGYGRLRYFDAQHTQFTVQTRCAPQGVGQAHLPDQITQLTVYRRAAWTGAGFPPPIGAKPLSVPTNNRRRRDDPDGVQEGRKEPVQPNEQQTISVPQVWSLRLATKDVELLT